MVPVSFWYADCGSFFFSIAMRWRPTWISLVLGVLSCTLVLVHSHRISGPSVETQPNLIPYHFRYSDA